MEDDYKDYLRRLRRKFDGDNSSIINPPKRDNWNVKGTVRKESRSYKCPRCGGEFNHWEGSSVGTGKQKCPFCGLKKGEYDGKSAEELKQEIGEILEKMESEE